MSPCNLFVHTMCSTKCDTGRIPALPAGGHDIQPLASHEAMLGGGCLPPWRAADDRELQF